MQRFILRLAALLTVVAVAAGPFRAFAADPCTRPAAGSIVAPAPDIYSHFGVLSTSLDYYTSVDGAGRTLLCFVTPSGQQSPTLHLHPGDTLELAVTNRNPPPPPGTPTHLIAAVDSQCGDALMTITSVNVHFHGTNVSPRCHGDDVITTLINSGQSFHYTLHFPTSEPPGLYWYHPHVHGIAEAATQGGASGAIVVEGIETIVPALAGLPERVMLIRDQVIPLPITAPPGAGVPPTWDLSLNYVPVTYPTYTPGIIRMQQGTRELWRVANAAADAVTDLEVRYDGVVQPLQVVALDGVPTGSQDGTRQGTPITRLHVLVPPAGRAEFVVAPPDAGVKTALFVTRHIDTGPGGDSDPFRPLARIETGEAAAALPLLPAATGIVHPQMFEGVAEAPATVTRKLYFSEVLSDPSNPASPTNFYITVDGATPVLFSPSNPPAIVTHQGSVEDWIIENRTREVHEFHMHQIHFQLTGRNGLPVAANERQFLDTIQVPYGSGKPPFPNVELRMDFRGMDVGDFVYHCHILAHEDQGMMAILRVLPPGK